MDGFTIQIAGLSAHVDPRFISTREYCRSYLTDSEPEIFISVSDTDLSYEQDMLDKEAVEEGLKLRKFSGPFLERASIQRKIAIELLTRKTILMHGSTIAVDGAAYLFSAPCGTGKSTHTRLWRELFGSRAVMINDDKPFLSITSDGVTAHGSPWSGKHGLDSNISVPLRGICLLRRGEENKIWTVDPEDCLEELLHYSFMPDDSMLTEMSHSLVSELSRKVSLWRMECTKDSEAALISYRAMSARGSK